MKILVNWCNDDSVTVNPENTVLVRFINTVQYMIFYVSIATRCKYKRVSRAQWIHLFGFTNGTVMEIKILCDLPELKISTSNKSIASCYDSKSAISDANSISFSSWLYTVFRISLILTTVSFALK